VAPFHFRYFLSRRQRFATELLPWVPAITGSLGFTIGLAYLSVEVSAWFLILLVIPVILYRSLFPVLFDLAIHSQQLVEMSVDDSHLAVKTGKKRLLLPLSGIIQVFRTGNAWTILHFNRSVLTIPADVVTEEQIDYLKSFARNAAAERKAAQLER
jgi:hypothetical protein